jgi:hypothetical protein
MNQFASGYHFPVQTHSFQLFPLLCQQPSSHPLPTFQSGRHFLSPIDCFPDFLCSTDIASFVFLYSLFFVFKKLNFIFKSTLGSL